MGQPMKSDVDAYQTGVGLFREGRLLEALAEFRFAATHGEDRPLEHFALATVAAKLGEVEEALREYRHFLGMNPGLPQQERAANNAILQLEAAAREISKRQEAEAAAHVARMAAQQQALAEESRLRELKSQAEQAQRLERVRKVRTLFEEALSFYRAGGYQSAMDRLNELATLWGRSEEVLNLMGLVFLGMGQWPQAEALFEEACQVDPSSRNARLNLARAHYEAGCARSRDVLSKLVQAAPEMAPAWFNLGIVLEAQGELESAHEAFCKAVALEPNDAQARAHLEYLKRRSQ